MNDPTTAKVLAIDCCRNEDCPCGNVYVRLLDERGHCFALAAVNPEAIGAICADLIEVRDYLRARTDRLAAEGDPSAAEAVARRRPVQ